MSRIDEVLQRRASAFEGGANRAADFGGDLAGHRPDASVLDWFAVERSAVGVENPHPRIVAPAARVERTIKRLTVLPELEGKLVVSRTIPSVTMEQYRRLAAVLSELQGQRGLRTLMVSSALPREGKSLTIANLALTLSESFQRRVLLIDADLRRPSLHSMFGIHNGAGLADVARGAGPAKVIEITPSLSLLRAGRGDANQLAQLTSDSVRALIDDAASRFDWVLLDTPPVGLLSDAQLVARLADGVLFVIAAGVTSYQLVRRCIAELGPERIVGTVLNKVDRRHLVAGSYYGGYYGETTHRK